MSDAMNVRSFHVILDAPADTVFDTLIDLRNMPRWSVHFCRAIRLVPDGAIVTSPSGEMHFSIAGVRADGVLDWWCGPTKETAERWPTRVVELPGGRSLYTVTAILGNAVPSDIDRMFADELGALKRLVEAPAPA
jgi:hypothetical protein